MKVLEKQEGTKATTKPEYTRRSLAGLGCCATVALSALIPASNSASLSNHLTIGKLTAHTNSDNFVPRIPSQLPLPGSYIIFL